MSTIFIGWGGNKELAIELEKKLRDKGFNIVRGGGTPNQMFVGSQVIEQMKMCDRAIILVENYEKYGFSTNLMFEWGYLVGYKRIKRTHVFLIDKPKSDLPTDLSGIWAEEVTRFFPEQDNDKQDNGSQPARKDDKTLAGEICDIFLELYEQEPAPNYFNIIDDWQYISRDLESDGSCRNTTEFAQYIVIGCLAAYYYNDNKRFRESLNRISASRGRLGDIVQFAKIYVDVFLKSGDMSYALNPEEFLYEQNIKLILNRKNREIIDGKSSVLDEIIDLLCYDLHGLIHLLNSKSPNLSEKLKQHYQEAAIKNFMIALEKTTALDERIGDTNECLISLLKSYIYNDLAHLYQAAGDDKNYNEYLNSSVIERLNLTYKFKCKFPSNQYLSDKFEQEYYIAYSEQSKNENDSLKLYEAEQRFNSWMAVEEARKKTEFTNRLLLRLKANLPTFGAAK